MLADGSALKERSYAYGITPMISAITQGKPADRALASPTPGVFFCHTTPRALMTPPPLFMMTPTEEGAGESQVEKENMENQSQEERDSIQTNTHQEAR